MRYLCMVEQRFNSFSNMEQIQKGRRGKKRKEQQKDKHGSSANGKKDSDNGMNINSTIGEARLWWLLGRYGIWSRTATHNQKYTNPAVEFKAKYEKVLYIRG